MRLKRLILAAAGGGLVAVGFVVPSDAGLTTFCDGVASDVTVPGNLVVAKGDTCELDNVTIAGRATVRPDANLLLTDSVVEGALRVRNNGFASVIETEVNGATRLNQAFGVYSEDSTHHRNVVAKDSIFYTTLGSTHGRDIRATNVETFLESSRVSRNIAAENAVLTDVHDTVVEGSLSVAGGEIGSVICLSEIDGDATFTGVEDLLQIGGQTPVVDCGFNVFGASLTLTGNTADTTVTGNVVRGDLVCSDNDPAPVLNNNRVRGEVACDTASAATFSTRSSTDAADKVADRKLEVAEKIEQRVEDSKKAADDAGHAFD